MLGVVLAVIACTADTVNWTPTPTFQWEIGECDQVECAEVMGARIFWGDAYSTELRGIVDLPYDKYDCSCEECGEPPGTRICQMFPGIEISYPLQRAIDAENEMIRFYIKFYSLDNVESSPTEDFVICMPDIWHPGDIYQ